VPDAAALAAAWLADPEVRAYLQVHEWDGVEWLVRDRWLALVELAAALDLAAGATRAAAAIGRLRPAAEAASDRVGGVVAAVADAARPRLAKSDRATPGGGRRVKRD